MNIRNRLKLAVETFNTSKSLSTSLGAVFRNYTKQSTFNPREQVTGITYKAIDKIGQVISTYEPQVVKKDGSILENHPIYVLRDQPNPRQNRSYFHHLGAMLDQIYGETFWYKVRGEMTGRIKEVYLLDPMKMEVVAPQGEVIGYILHKDNGGRVPFDVDEIHHDMRPNPFNEFRGMSVLEKAALYVDTEIKTGQFTLNYIKNNASPSGIVQLPKMSPETFKIFTEKWRQGYEGPENAGKTAFIRGEGVDFKAVGATLQDIDQKVTRDMAKDDVLMMLGVPRPLLGLTDDKGYGRGNLEALEYTFAKNTIEPMMDRLDAIWGEILKSYGKQSAEYKITHESPVPEDKEFEHKQIKDLVNVALTVNEVREMMGKEPIPGGDILMPENTVKPTRESDKQKEVVKVTLKKQESKSEKAVKENEEREAFRQNLININDIYVKKLKKEISIFAHSQKEIVISKLNTAMKAYNELLPEIKEEAEDLAAILLPVVIDLMEAQAEGVTNFITGEILVISPELRKEVESKVLQISGLYNEETIKELEKTLTQGITNGESLVKLKKRVESVYSDAQGYRAERIARTESLRASNHAAEQVYKASGYSRVMWFTNPGACQWCITFEGKTKEIGGTYLNVGDVITGAEDGQMRIEYSDIETPPLHPNCTCTLIPVV